MTYAIVDARVYTMCRSEGSLQLFTPYATTRREVAAGLGDAACTPRRAV